MSPHPTASTRHYHLPTAWKAPFNAAGVFCVLTVLSALFLLRFVNLEPRVNDDFFFSSDDPQYQSEHLISKLFLRNDRQIIISATGDITSPDYAENIRRLSTSLLALDQITGVKSITHGPNNLNDALKSPLWKRLLISDDRSSSNIILFLKEGTDNKEMVPLIEALINTYSSGDFKLHTAGLPYVVELIRRNLLRDLRFFSLIAVIVFGFIIFQLFHSRAVLLGAFVSCLGACMWTLMTASLASIPVGLLTANLGTIVFILTLSHIIFLSYNWKNIRGKGESLTPVEDAVRLTFSPSFWSMLTTLLGFLSLLSVEAKPLRELGASGAIGTVIAIGAAYGVFPAFLKRATYHDGSNAVEQAESSVFQLLDKHKGTIMLIVLTVCILALPGLLTIDSDPSLLSYFSKNSEIHRGLEYIDRNGGSSPLIFVVRLPSNERLASKKSYQQLWELQEMLEQHRSVGSVVSLPVLLAEAKRSPLTFFLTWNWLIDILEKPQFEEIAKMFVSKERTHSLFLLRMTETNRHLSRLAIIEELKKLARGQGFYPEIVGGVYNLQGHLARLVASSLVFGLFKLLLLFALIAWLTSRSLRITTAITLSICLLPIIILGLVGLYRIPLDIVSAPASNIAIAIGIDSMFHMVKSYRRNGDWQAVREELYRPILTSMFVVTAGFAIFLASTFPPTQRFGGAILAGTVLAALIALFIMPFLHEQLKFVKRQRSKSRIGEQQWSKAWDTATSWN
ncbi:MAG: MMPL family transporter [Candidatus Omnitrophica bacterium]|nr:MMPL family transporter [Candidatus Omnitrophota bacterium]